MSKQLNIANTTPYFIDARNMRCPLPLLKLKQGLHQIKIGQTLQLITNESASKNDFKAFIAQTPHILTLKQLKSDYHFMITKQ
jgi:tRNA 2-thiouridine synthesizing protein A